MSNDEDTHGKRQLKKREQGHAPVEFPDPQQLLKIRSAFFSAFRFRSGGKAYGDYAGFLKNATSAMQAQLEIERTVKILNDADRIHEIDKWERQDKHEQAKHDLEIAQLNRKRTLQDAIDDHEEWERKRTGKDQGIELDDLSPDEEDFLKEFVGSAGINLDDLKDADQSKVRRHRAMIAAIIDLDTEKLGGRDKLTEEDIAKHERWRKAGEQVIRDMALKE